MKTKQLEIEQYVYEKRLKENAVVNIPLQAYYYQSNYHAVFTGVFPVSYEINGGVRIDLEIVRLDSGNITRAFVMVNERQISEKLHDADNNKLATKSLEVEVLLHLRDEYEQFQISAKEYVKRLEQSVNNILKTISYE